MARWFDLLFGMRDIQYGSVARERPREKLPGNPACPESIVLSHRLAIATIGLAASTLLLFNTAARRATIDFQKSSGARRLWDDLAVAVTLHLDQRFPIERSEQNGLLSPDEARDTYMTLIPRRASTGGIAPWEFWKTIPDKALLRQRAPLSIPRGLNDQGRSLVLAGAFRFLGGVSPFAILWLGALFAIPVLLCTVSSFARAGRPVAAAAFVLLVASSPFLVESLSLPRSPVGFYLVGALLLVPLAALATLGPPPSRSRFLLWTFLAGVVFAIVALCRSGCLFLLPGYALCFWFASRSPAPAAAAAMSRGPSPSNRLAFSVVALVLLLFPYLLLPRSQHHDAWQPIWEGLGDFDRTKGHSWSDAVALRVVQASGGQDIWTPEAEVVLQRLVIDHVRGDPLWFGEILMKRLVATVTQSKLRPWAWRDGRSMSPAETYNEGAMDKYYRYTTTVDFLGFGASSVEVPISLAWASLLVVLGLRGFASRLPDDVRLRIGGAARMLLVLAAATLPLPILITTAGGQETQAFALVYMLGAAFLVEELFRLTRHVRWHRQLTPLPPQGECAGR